MPTYHACGVSAHLGVMPLISTITGRIVLRKGETSKEQCETAEKKLLGSKLLIEKPVAFPGDEAGFRLNWLGNAPFMQVQARKDFAYDNDMVQSLALHVHLSKKTFVSGLNDHKTHLKIEVLFNGQLTNCVFFPLHDFQSGAKPLLQVFAGTRVDFLAERPWVILPPGVGANGQVRVADNSVSVIQRWQDICLALQTEAKARGIDQSGNIPPSSEFLTALAAMQMPEQVGTCQPLNGKQFGVIDLVISAGDGKKVTSGTTYLKAPKRLADKNYPLMLGSDGIKQHSQPAQLERSDEEEDARPVMELSPELVDMDAEGYSDLDDEPQPKRRVMTPRILSTRCTTAALNTSASQYPFTGMHIPPPIPLPSLIDSPTKRQDSLRASFIERNDAHCSETAALPKHDRASGFKELDNMDAGSDMYSTLDNFDTGLSMASIHTPDIRNSLFEAQFSDSIWRHPTFSVSKHFMSVDTSRSMSSPPQRCPLIPNGSVPLSQRPSLAPAAYTNHSILGSNAVSTSYALSEHSRHALFGPQFHSPFLYPTPPSSSYLSHMGMESPGVYTLPNLAPGTSPCPPSFVCPGKSPYHNYAVPPPINSRHSAMLPPTGLFTVPKKPKHVSFLKGNVLVFPERIKAKIPVNRLIITGHNGIIIIDHRWPMTKYLGSGLYNQGGNWNESELHIENSLDHSEPVKAIDATPILRRFTRNGGMVEMPPSTCSNEDAISTDSSTHVENLPSVAHEVKMTDESNQCDPVNAAQASEVQKLHVEADESSIKVDKLSANEPKMCPLTTVQPVPQRRMTFGNAVLGVQGPKATTFWLEDPEEVLREAAKLRRSRSLMKQEVGPVSIELGRVSSGQIVPDRNAVNTVSSSPLSSVPSTPERDVNLAPHSGPTQQANMPQPRTSLVATLESFTRREIPPTPRSSRPTPSPPKLVSMTIPRLQASTQSPPKSSPSPNTRKRKLMTQSRPRLPRSPNRLRTIDNPPLNKDCVIAYAESEDKDSKNGVLRQIRGERQGVFQEEYVVFAARFFVAGD